MRSGQRQSGADAALIGSATRKRFRSVRCRRQDWSRSHALRAIGTACACDRAPRRRAGLRARALCASREALYGRCQIFRCWRFTASVGLHCAERVVSFVRLPTQRASGVVPHLPSSRYQGSSGGAVDSARRLRAAVMLVSGAHATIQGLQSREDLNGVVVILLSWIPTSGRWRARTDAGEVIALKSECLSVDVSKPPICLAPFL